MDSMESQYKFQVFLVETDRLVLNFMWKNKGPSVKNYTEPEMLLYFQAKKLIYHSFMNSGRRRQIPGSEMKNSLSPIDIPLLSI